MSFCCLHVATLNFDLVSLSYMNQIQRACSQLVLAEKEQVELLMMAPLQQLLQCNAVNNVISMCLKVSVMKKAYSSLVLKVQFSAQEQFLSSIFFCRKRGSNPSLCFGLWKKIFIGMPPSITLNF